MSGFIESVDDMIARHFSFDAITELRDNGVCEIKDWAATEKIIQQLIRTSIAHARKQAEGRKTGTMTFDEAMQLVLTRDRMVTRPTWDIFLAVRNNEDSIFYWKFDNCDGDSSGTGWPYRPTEEDRSATDWMIYQAPQGNWVELDF